MRVVSFVVLLSACTGTIGGGVDPDDPPPTEGPHTPTPPPPAADACATPDTSPSVVTHLSRTEYGYAVEDLLGVPALASRLSRDEWTDGLRDGITRGFLVGAYVSPVLAEQYVELAHEVAIDAVEATTTSCEAVDESCARDVIRRLGPRAFRRPVSTEQEEELLSLYRLGAEESPRRGIQMVLEGLLTSPEFLYHVEALDAADGARVVLSGYERAARLSFFLWRSVPDDTLLEAARTGALDRADGVAEQTRRMMMDARFDRAVREFYEQWAGLRFLDGAVRDAELYPELTDVRRDALRDSFARFAVEVSRGARFEDVFRSPVLFTSPELDAIVEGPAASGVGERRTSDVRRGVLGQPAFLAAHAHHDQTDPIRRGLFVRQRVLCQPLEPPAGLALPPPPEREPGLTTRERFAEHRENEACAGCHAMMDPVGFGLEAFDAVGRFRTHEDGLRIDTRGELARADVEVDFDGLEQLSARLASSELARACFARQWLHFALAREETDADACAVARGYEAARDATFDELVVALTTSPSFLERRIPRAP